MKSTYTNFIAEYNTLRKVLRQFYIYGCYNRKDFEDKFALSGRSYDDAKRRVTYCIEKKYAQEKYINNHKYFSLNCDPFLLQSNFLINMYLLKRFGLNDLNYFFLIQQLLASSKQALSFKEILDKLADYISPDIIAAQKPLRKRLHYLATAGLIQKSPYKNSFSYQTPPDFFAVFDKTELISLYHALFFYAATALISSPGYYLQNTLKKYLWHKFQYVVDTDLKIFSFKHLNLSRILDDAIVAELLQNIIKKTAVKLTITSNGSSENLVCYPLKLVTEYLYSRQYLLYFLISSQEIAVVRIDDIEEVRSTTSEIPFPSEQLLANWFAKSWCSSFDNNKKQLITVEIDFYFSEISQVHILNRLKKEQKWGVLQRLANDHYLFSIDVLDPNELIPWIRSFANFAKVRPAPQHQLFEKIAQDWQEAFNNYVNI